MRPRERLFPILAIGTVAAGLPALVEWTAGGHHVQIDGRVHGAAGLEGRVFSFECFGRPYRARV